MKTDPMGTLREAASRGPMVRMRFGPAPGLGLGMDMCLVTDPELVGYVLHDNQKNYVKAPTYGPIRTFLGEGLITSEGETWRRHRKLVQPVFHHQNIVALGPTMVDAAEDWWADVEPRVRAGEVLDVTEEMSRLALDVACRCFFGTRATPEVAAAISRDLGILLRFAVVRIGLPAWIEWLPLPPVRRAFRAMDSLHSIAASLLEEGARNPTRDLGTLLREARDEEHGGLTPDQVRDHAMTFLLAGHETSANALAWTWALLAKHPEVRDRLHQEVDALGGRSPTMDDLPALDLTRRVLEESMRLYPPAWIVERQAVGDDEIGGVHLPAGTLVATPALLLHHDPDLWPDPERFDPDRFLPEAGEGRSRYAYLPFGAGARACIGQEFAMTELTLLLASLASRLALEATGPIPAGKALITLRPKGGLRMRARARGVAEAP
jgi:cytochrome P450